MKPFVVKVGGKEYDVDAPDEATAWKWANATHLQAIKNDPKPNPAPPQRPLTLDEKVLKGDRRAEVPYDTGAKVNDAAAKYLPAPLAAGLGAATNAGLSGAEIVATGGMGLVAGAAARPALQAAAHRTMQSAIKPTSADLRTGKADRAVQTLLDEGINVSRGGAHRLREMGEEVNRQTAAEIAASTATVNPNAVASRLLDTERRFQAQVNPQADLRAIQDAWTDFGRHPQMSPAIPVQLAQELKQGTYRQLRDRSYGELGSAATEAQKALARGLKEEIETAVPAVVPLNRRSGELFNALNVTERRALMAGNNNPIGLTALTGNPATAALFAVDRSSRAKSMIARALNQTGNAAPYLGAGAGAASVLLKEGE